ncbi:MAG: ferredoxin, partial [Xanthomonadales bacterium]|nr:ferredoxin [Xanthomonadales bacterium]
MSHGASPLAAFHRLGDRARLPVRPRVTQRPALYGPYRDVYRLRGDYPLLIAPRPGAGEWLQSLTDTMNALARRMTRPGPGDEPVRRQLLALEQAIRNQIRDGQQGALDALASAAAQELSADGADPDLLQNLERVREALENPDAEVVGCNPDSTIRMLRRAWRESEHAKGERLNRRIRRLAQRLADLLRADEARSRKAREARTLERALGGADRTVFDFEAMAQILRSAPSGAPMPARRRRRIRAAIDTLRKQRFTDGDQGSENTYAFEFDSCSAALEAFRRRLPAMRDLVRAIGIAELEIDNRYDESRHDAFFREYSEDRLGPADLEAFPSYLLRLRNPDPDERARLLALLESGLQFKIIVQVDDILCDISIIEEQLSFGRWAQHLARMALGLDQIFVLQATDTLLYRLRDAVLRGFAAPQPALFSVYSGRDYLASAAAVESRAFPCFVHDPEAGDGQAQRYSLQCNPQAERDWPRHPLHYEAPSHACAQQETAFTLADFMAADPRFESCFAALTAEEAAAETENELVPVAEYLALGRTARLRALPYVLVIDEEDRLQRAVVDDKVIEAAERCQKAWRSLQELGGIGNTHVAAALAKARATAPAPAAAQPAPPAATPTLPAAQPAAETAPEPAPEDSSAPAASDDPWIETIRCTTCNECTQINDRMFAYNADQRAYVADPDAGTYRELVQAAESCQVAIIHPGKPRNPDEPGLDELLKRAEPF